MNSDSFYKEFGKALRRLRRQKGFTQSELAERVGLSRTSVTNIEVGRQKIPLHFLYILSSSLGVEPGELLPDKEKLSAKDQDFLIDNISGTELNDAGHGWLTRVLKPRQTEKKGESYEP